MKMILLLVRAQGPRSRRKPLVAATPLSLSTPWLLLLLLLSCGLSVRYVLSLSCCCFIILKSRDCNLIFVIESESGILNGFTDSASTFTHNDEKPQSDFGAGGLGTAPVLLCFDWLRVVCLSITILPRFGMALMMARLMHGSRR